MINVSNEDFLKTLFGDDHIWAHVTSFPDDPSNITADRRLACWSGNYHSRYLLQPDTNQYYTISTFFGDDNGKARRRKALFRATHVIVADDVREKLPHENALRLPEPTFKLETSPGSEQWGWVLDTPATDRHQVENLLDGLVDKGLAPDGKDPGMKGVTRYVRLPEGVNSKASKLVNGVPRKCVMLEWHPERRVSLEQLADPFDVDLHAARRESRVDGAADVGDHPLLNLGDIIKIKEVRSDGRFDITCPWVADHTGQSDDGAAVFTNGDGTIGFKCHHGGCQERTGRDLLNHIERQPGHGKFKQQLNSWQVMRTFGSIATAPVTPDFMGSTPAVTTQQPQTVTGAPDFLGATPAPAPAPQPDQLIGYQTLIDQLTHAPRNSEKALEMAKAILKSVDTLGYADRLQWWEKVRDHMAWAKPDFSKIVDDLRKEWYAESNDISDFYDECVYIAEQNQFFNPTKRMFYSAEAYQNAFGHLDDQARTEALINGRVDKVDRLDYAPGMPPIFTEDGVKYVNSWREVHVESVHGDVQRWLDHFDVLGWGDHRKHILQWMAYTIRHPERKINHILLLGGGEGNGKDFLLHPLMRAMGRDSTTIEGDELLHDFNDYLMSTKYLHINETEMGDRAEARRVTNKLKPLASCPPNYLRVNIKGVKGLLIRNVVNVTMTSNSAVPIRLDSGARRYYAVWTDVVIRNENGDMTDEWRAYWGDRWNWMRDCEGWRACLHYLRTQVDLSDFDPGSVPVVTDFVRDIQEASEDPIMTVIKQLKTLKLGNFKADLLTAQDILATVKAVPMLLPDLAASMKVPPLSVIGKVMKQNRLGVSVRCRNARMDRNVWVVRNADQYTTRSPADIAKLYEHQMSEIRTATPVAAVS